MYIISRNSKNKTIHNQHCKYAKIIKSENQLTYNTYNQALKTGNSVCKYCNYAYTQYRKNEKSIRRYCKNRKMKISFGDYGINIHTKYGDWILFKLNANTSDYIIKISKLKRDRNRKSKVIIFRMNAFMK